MKTTYLATIALLLAGLGSSYAIADDATQASSRAKVLAELAEAKRTGDLIDAHSGKKLNELYPNLYPAKAVKPGITREQVLAELAEAKRTGDLVDGHTGKKLKELYPGQYVERSVEILPGEPIAAGRKGSGRRG